MSDEPSLIITKDQVRAVLASLYDGRSKRDGRHYVRSILHRYGGGATSINDLDPFYYGAVIAAVTIPVSRTSVYPKLILNAALIDHYGTVTDVQPTPAPPVVRNDVPSSRPSRIRSPLTLALEAELAKARAKTKRSAPNYVVNTGNASRVGDQADDAPQPEYPAGMEKLS